MATRLPEHDGAAVEILAPVPFIVGAGRSGTTLLRLMLDAHPDLAIPSESRFIPLVTRACAAAMDPAACFLEKLTGHPRWGDFPLDEALLQQRITRIKPFSITTAWRTLFGLYAEGLGKQRWGDKTTVYMLQMPLLQSLFPEARFIHLIRDGRDVALSIKDLWFGPNSVAEAAAWWISRITQARQDARLLRHYLEVRYEDLLVNPEFVLRQMCAYIDLPWDPRMLTYHQGAESRMAELSRDLAEAGKLIPGSQRLAYFHLVTSPPDRSRIGRWRTQMAPADRQAFEAVAGQLLHQLGYPID